MNVSFLMRTVTLLSCAWMTMLPAAAVNLLPNGNFENATLTDWLVFPAAPAAVLDTTGSYEGVQSAHVDVAGASGGQMFQRYTGPGYLVGKTHYYRAYVKTTVGTGGTPQVYLSTSVKVSGVFYNVTVHDLRSGAAANMPAWTPIEAAFTVQTGRSNAGDPVPAGDFLALRIHLDTPGVTGTSTLYVDDVILEEVTVDPINRLSNPGFELGFASWLKFPTTIATEIDVAAPHGGSRAAKVTLNQEDGYLYQTYAGADFFTGSDLHFGAWVKATFAGPGGSVALARDTMINGSFGNDFVVMTTLAGDQASWTYLSTNGVLAAGPPEGSPPVNAGDALYFRMFGLASGVTGGPSTVYWDDTELWPSDVPVELSSFGLE